MRNILKGGLVGTAFFLSVAERAVAQEACDISVNFEDAELSAVIDEFALRTGRKFVVDPRVNGEVTIKSGVEGGLCPEEAWELFQAGLRAAGFSALPINEQAYRIIPLPEAARSATAVGDARPGDYVTQIVRLKHIDAREAGSSIGQLIGERAVVTPLRSGNSLILVDSKDNIDRLVAVLERIDVDSTIYRTLSLEHASATEVAQLVDEFAAELAKENGIPNKVSVVPIEASNSILIRAEPEILARLAGIVAELDRIGESTSDLTVISLNHANAEELVPLLKEIANTQTSGGEGNATRARAAISFHQPTNSVIISGDAAIQQTLRNVIAQLDVRRAQVLVEAIIVEVSDTTARELGLQYFLSGDGSTNGNVPFTATNFSSAQPNILANAGAFLLDSDALTGGDDAAADALAATALNSLLGINGFALGGAGQFGDGSVFGAILTALQQDDNSRILSFPSVLTLDNQPATLSVGQEIPITTGEAVGDNLQNAFRTVSREEVGVILEVTPQINEGDTVTLSIRQETSSVAGQIIATSTDLITNKSVIETTALVDDTDILVLGGLIDQSDTDLEDKVPFLGDLPVAGNLFKTSSRSRERDHLMIFIRPTIMRDRDSARLTTQKKLDYIRARELLSSPRAQSEIDRLIEQVTGPGLPRGAGQTSE